MRFFFVPRVPVDYLVNVKTEIYRGRGKAEEKLNCLTLKQNKNNARTKEKNTSSINYCLIAPETGIILKFFKILTKKQKKNS